jgi:hypothetical protein
MEIQYSSLSLTAREPFLPHQRARTPDSPLKGRKLKPATLQAAPEALLPQGTQKPSTAPHCRRVTSLWSKTWNPSSSTEWQSTTLLLLEGLPPRVHRDPLLQLQESPYAPIKEWELQPPHWGNWHHNKNPASGNLSSIPLSEEHCWSSRRKKNLKTPTTGAQEIKTITKTNSRCINLNVEWNSKTAALHQKPVPLLKIQTPV